MTEIRPAAAAALLVLGCAFGPGAYALPSGLRRSTALDNAADGGGGADHSDDIRRRSLSTTDGPCMEEASGISPLGCTSQDIKFNAVAAFDILNGPTLYPCNCTSSISTICGQYDIECGEYGEGTVFGACAGGNGNDEVLVKMNVDVEVTTTRYDVGMYIATNGGSALNGETCSVSSLQYGTYGDVTVYDVEGDGDACFDLGSSGVMNHYPFAPVTLSCTDSDGDGLLDFDIGIVWSVKKGDYQCDVEAGNRPIASSAPKCWYDEGVRATVPIFVPPSPAPSPNTPPAPSPGDNEPCVDDFNLCYALDMSGSVCNGDTNSNCHDCPIDQCRDDGFDAARCCTNFEKVRQFAMDMTGQLDSNGGTVGTSVVEFATTATTISPLSTDEVDTQLALVGMVYSGGWTHHQDAIEKCQASFASSDSARKNFIVLVTDGIPTKPDENPGPQAEQAASDAKGEGTVILPVFISSSGNEDQLAYMRRLSGDGNVFDVTNFDELNGLIEDLTTRVLCSIPAALDDYKTTPMNTPVTIPVLHNDTHDGTAIVSAITQPEKGAAAFGGSAVSYQPPTDYVGTATFEYSLCQMSDGRCDDALVTVVVLPPAPEAIDDYAETPMNTRVDIPVLDNDISMVPLTIGSITVLPEHGTVFFGGTLDPGTVQYFPEVGFQGTDAFKYEACDEFGQCDEATVTVTIGPPNVEAMDDYAYTPVGTPVTIAVLANDQGEDLEVRSLPQGSTARGSQVSLNSDGTVEYVPGPDFNAGVDTFPYVACTMGTDLCDAATVTVTTMSAVDDFVVAEERTSVNIPVLSNDYGESLMVSKISEQPLNGRIDVQGDGTVVYTPNTGFLGGEDSFLYEACEGDVSGLCDTATVTILLPNRPPVAHPNFVDVVFNGDAYISVLDNDSDPDEQPLRVTEVKTPELRGTVEVTSDQQRVYYVAPQGFSGLDTFTYETCDVDGLCDEAVVTVAVNPIAVDNLVETEEDQPVFELVLENDLGFDLNIEFVDVASNGVCFKSGAGIMYVSSAGYVGRDECAYTACTRGTYACATARLIINVIAAPTVMPSAMPSEPPTEAWYYPDWINNEQVCKNDYLEPEYMLEVQRKNYLYRSKELCCENHFWWRITQCMANEHPMYFSNGEKCEQKVYFEYHESKYTPSSWDSSDLFETLEECCVAKFWWDIPGCLATSPRELKLYFTMDVRQLVEPAFCQDADIVANALVTAVERGLDTDLRANVTSIGCATITRNPDTGNPECGGCLAGQDFLGGTLGTTVVEDATGVVTTVEVEIRKKCYESKTDEDILKLTGMITTMLRDYINPGSLTAEIQSYARERIPQVGQLFESEVIPSSFQLLRVVNPFDRADAKHYPDWVDTGTCANDGLEPTYMQNNPSYYLFDTAADCCSRWFPGDSACGSS